MRKNFLLLLWLAILPMALWAAAPSAVTGLKYTGSAQTVATAGTDYNTQYRYAITQGTSKPAWGQSSTTLPTALNAGTYRVYWASRYNGAVREWQEWNNQNNWFEVTIDKAEVTVELFQVVRMWRGAGFWSDPTVASMEPSSYSLGTSPFAWDDIKGYLSWNQLQAVTDVGSYKYTLTAAEAQNFNIHVDGTAAELKVEQNNTAGWAQAATDGANLTYSGEAQQLLPTAEPFFEDADGVTAGTIQYRIIAPTADATDWADAIPTATNAATYTIEYKGISDINHTEFTTTKTYNVTIDPYELVEGTDFTAPTAKTDLPYNEAAQVIATAGEFTGKFAAELATAGAKFQYDGADDLPEQTNVGTYSFDWDIDLGTSTNFSYTTGATTVSGATIIEVDIVAADVTEPVGATGLEYILDTKQQLIATGAVVATDAGTATPKGEAWYSVDGGTWTNDLTKVVGEHVKANGESYVISWYIKGNGNWNDYGSETTPAGTVEVAIAPVQFVLTADAEPATGLVYSAAPQKLVAKSVTGGAANMPQGSTSWKLNGADVTGTYEDIKGTDAGTYTISYTVVPKEAKYENDYLPYNYEFTAFIDQYTLYIGAKPLSGTVEDFFDLENGNAPKFTMFDFLKDGAFIGGESDAEKKAILNQLIVPTPAMEDIFASAKVGGNVIALNKVDIDPDVTPMNYKVDAATLLSDEASLNITAIEAAIQADPVAATLTYNGDDQELVGTAAEGYKANGGAGTVAIGKVVYSLEKEGTYTDDLTTIVGKDADDYKVYYKVELSEEPASIDRFYVYTAAVKELPVTIDQKELDIAMFEFDPAALTAVYNGQNQLPVITTVATEPITTDDWYFEFADGAGNPIADINTGVKDVDDYVITFKAEADGNYKEAATPTTATWSITQKELADEMFTLSADVIYTGAAQQPTISTGDEPIDAANDYDIEVKDSEGNLADINNLVDADTYTFNFIAKAGGNYQGSASADWTIGQKELTADMFALAYETKVYNGENQMPAYTFADGDPSVLVAADFTPATTNAAEEAVTEMIDVDTYTFTFTAAADGNYKGEIEKIFTITQDEAEFVLAEANKLTYNGKEQALVTEAATDAVDGVVEYQVIFNGETLVDWTDDFAAIVARNAGDYTVKTKFTASELNYSNPEVVEEVAVTINKATIGYNLSNLEKVWDGELFTEKEIATLFTLYAGGEGGMLFDGDEYDKPFTLTLPEDYRDAGTYTFKQPKVEFKEGYPVNYNVNFAGEAQIVINKADIVADDFDAPAAIAGVIYTGEEQAIVEEGAVTAEYDAEYPTTALAGKAYGKMVYADAADAEEWSETAPKGTEAGDYDVYFKILGDQNHNDTEATKIENVKIGEATLTEDFLPEEYETELPYKGSAYEATDFIPALEGITLDEGYEVFAPEMINAGEYELLYKGINNYAGEFTVTVNVTKLNVVATAPKGVTKVYDGTASLEGVVTNEEISFNGVLSTDEFVLPTELALTTEGIAVGKYAIKVDASKFTAEMNPNYNVLAETIDGELTINAAPAIKVGFDEVPVWTKKFGETDPELTGYTVAVTDGDFFDNIDDVLAATTAKRAEGEDVDTYDVTLTIDATADVFKNYEGVEFDGTAAEFEITKADKTYTVSLANITETYKAEEFATAIEFAAEDLVIAGYEGDKADFFTTLPTATLAAGAKTVGNYNITLAGGESQNYNFTFVPATFTIEPFTVTEATIADQKVQKGKELDVTAFTITVPGEDADYFYVTAPGLVDMNDIVTGDKGVYEDGLVIAVDDEVAANYAGLDAFTADLEIIAADAIILADDATFETEAKENADVTFSSRAINSNKWNVCALPFATTVSQISDAFGYAVVDVLNETNAIDNEMHFKVITSGDIPAYTPFLFKPTEDDDVKVTNFDQVVFSGVNIEKGGNKNYDVADAAGNKFWGTFMETTTFYGAKYWYMSKGVWKDAANYTKAKPVSLKPFRAYCEIVNPAGARIVIEEEDGTLTSIDAASFNSEDMTAEGWYTIEGKKLNAAPTQKGVYIQNGKKVVIK